MDKNCLDKLLLHAEKPARYTGGEYNSTVKEDAAFRFAICFPDVYEIGMSHLGSRILYQIINDMPDIACERVFAPWPDMEQALRDHGVSLYSLETKRSLASFDVVGFSLLYEMCYTNILTMLDLAGIPFCAAERGEEMPLVIAGGACMCNPEPVANLFDAIVIGDGEEVTPLLIETVRAAKREGLPKKEILKRLTSLRGIYVPSLYDSGEQTSIVRAIVHDLDKTPYIEKQIVPYLDIVHDRVAIEVMRGCTRGCRFCQAGYIYRPVRERSRETLLKQAQHLVDDTGYDEVSLLSLSTGDYSEVHALVPEIIDSMEACRVSVSLPSLRIDSFLKDDLEKMQSVRKGGLTFAPEAGTQRLRDVINKNVQEADLLRATADAFDAGWSSVKLYFMIGLPTETDEDVLGIAELARKVSQSFYAMPKEKRGKGLRLTVSASTFVPKPFSAFQWCPQCAMEEILRKQQLLRVALKGIRGVQFSCHPSRLSVLEAAFSRGDRKLCDILVHAYRGGCRFDSWSEHFKPRVWDEAFAAYGCTPEDYADYAPMLSDKLPWDHVDMLVTKEYLAREYKKAMQGETTRDCRAGCNGCFGEHYADDCGLS